MHRLEEVNNISVHLTKWCKTGKSWNNKLNKLKRDEMRELLALSLKYL